MTATSGRTPVVALLTDFGSSDPYAGIMKGMILNRAPGAQVVDLTHGVPPQAVSEAAFLLEISWRYFPAGTVFLVVVDPGVGSSRGRLAIESNGMTFIGPDNGCLSPALHESIRGRRGDDEDYLPRTLQLDGSVTAVSIENEALFNKPVSSTFEGRDVFAPVAAYLAAGGGLSSLGPPLQGLQVLPAFRAPRRDGRLIGRVVHIDTYGNLITDIRAEDVPVAARFLVRYQEAPLVLTYAASGSGRVVAIPGSSGFIELAVSNGNAARSLAASVGDVVEELAAE